MKVLFDEGNYVSDMEKVVKDAINRQPSLIVVPSDREMKTFERHFGKVCSDKAVNCCTFDDYYTSKWMMLEPRPKHCFIFRQDDILYNLSGTTNIDYVTVRGLWKKDKKEVSTNEKA